MGETLGGARWPKRRAKTGKLRGVRAARLLPVSAVWFARGNLLGSALAAVLFLLLVGLIVRLRKALQQADERFTAAMEGLNDPVYVEDVRSGEILYSNRRYAETFGAGRPRFNGAIRTAASCSRRCTSAAIRPSAPARSSSG